MYAKSIHMPAYELRASQRFDVCNECSAYKPTGYIAIEINSRQQESVVCMHRPKIERER